MNITNCMNCQSGDLYGAEMSRHSIVQSSKGFWPRYVRVQCTVCLSCGFIAPYLAPADVEKVRAWKVQDSSK